jgi:magnesium-transporting ATPase (P-type)
VPRDVARIAHSLEPDAVVRSLDGDAERGLSTVVATERLRRLGPNAVGRPPRPAYARIAVRQLVDPLVALLVAAAVVSAAVGQTLEAAVIW